ncbi:MAG: hypothetical protein HC905_29985 [Bacteroidales bacterium]|nr:hypothetical protein [Bacteroidales bacterium]
MLNPIISAGDFVDIYYKLKSGKLMYLLLNLFRPAKKRAVAKWNGSVQSSDFGLSLKFADGGI